MPARRCPVCRQGDLGRHCPDTNTSCAWLRCTLCGARFDRVNRRIVTCDGQPVAWPTDWPRAAS